MNNNISKNENSTEKILTDDDLKIITGIAEKYSITVQELGRILTRKNYNYPRLQILLNVDEVHSIDRKATSLNLSRSKYCSMCCRKVLREELYKDIDVLKAVGESGKRREHRAVISFDYSSDYLEFKKLSEELGIPFSSLVRYFALTVEL